MTHPHPTLIPVGPEARARARLADARLSAAGQMIAERERLAVAHAQDLTNTYALCRAACSCIIATVNVKGHGMMFARFFWPFGRDTCPAPEMASRGLLLRAAGYLLLALESWPTGNETASVLLLTNGEWGN